VDSGHLYWAVEESRHRARTEGRADHLVRVRVRGLGLEVGCKASEVAVGC
jgi:hypothetical protein